MHPMCLYHTYRVYFYSMHIYLPTSTIGTLGQCVLISGYHLLDTFSKELRALMEKQTRKQSVCKKEVRYYYVICITKRATYGCSLSLSSLYKKILSKGRRIRMIK